MRKYFICLVGVILFSCNQTEVESAFTKTQFRRLLAGTTDKTWEILSNGSGNFISCNDALLYTFMESSGDTGMLFIIEPLIDCNEMAIADPDTLRTLQWTLTDSESSLFDDRLFLIENETTQNLTVGVIDPTRLVLNFSENVTLVFDSLSVN